MNYKFWKKDKKTTKVHLISCQGISEIQQTKLESILESKGIKACVTPFAIHGSFILED